MSAYISTMDEEPRRATVPVLYTRGTHYEVGYDIVSPLIHSISKKVGAVPNVLVGVRGNGQLSFSIFPDFSHSKLAPQWLNGANPFSNHKLFLAKPCVSLGTTLHQILHRGI